MQRQIDPILQKTLDSIPKTPTGAIDLTKANVIAIGSTHELYRFPDSPFVVKLMKKNLNPKELDKLEKDYAVLYAVFDKDGKQRCIREQHITHHVLLSSNDKDREGRLLQDAALSIVPYENCFKAKIKFDFKIEPAELDPCIIEKHKELFLRANKTLINNDKPEPNFNIDEYANIDACIGAILQRLDSDPKLRDTMIEFLNHYRDFYHKTSIILDAMGFENILFFKDEADDWQFKIGSAIKHDSGKNTNELFDKINAGSEVNLNDIFNYTHAYLSPANIRAVNVCAMKLGLDPVVSDVTINPDNLVKISQQLPVPERMLSYARYGDFEKMSNLLHENKQQLSFELGCFSAYSQIADEYIKHGQSPEALKNYLDTVSELPLKLPENKEHAKLIEDSKTTIINLKNIIDKNIIFHKKLTTSLTQRVPLKPIASTTAMLMNNGIAKKSSSTMSEEDLQQENSENTQKIDAQPKSDSKQLEQAEIKEPSNTSPTPFDSLDTGPKPRGS